VGLADVRSWSEGAGGGDQVTRRCGGCDRRKCGSIGSSSKGFVNKIPSYLRIDFFSPLQHLKLTEIKYENFALKIPSDHNTNKERVRITGGPPVTICTLGATPKMGATCAVSVASYLDLTVLYVLSSTKRKTSRPGNRFGPTHGYCAGCLL